MKFEIEAWSDSDYGRLAIRFDRGEGCKGLRRTWFILNEDELNQLIKGNQFEFVDGYHHLSIIGDSATFYDFEFPSNDAGEIKVPYFRFDMPRVFWKYLMRIARFIWRESKLALANGAEAYYVPRVRVPVSDATIQRFQNRYGHASGNVDVELCPTLEKAIETSEKLKEKVAYITQVAKGYTRNVYRNSKLVFYDDHGDYGWTAVRPNGIRGMNGGLINHARREGGEEWGVHT